MDVTPCREKWAGTMTDRERFVAQMHYQPVDRCFNMEFGYWNENFEQWRIFKDNGIKDNGEADRFFSFDTIRHVGGTVWMHPLFEEKEIARTATTRTLQDSSGLTAELPLDGHSTIPHFTGSAIRTPDDWQRCKEERFRRDDPQRRIDVETLKAHHPADRDYPLGVNVGSMIGKVRDMLTMEGLAYACCDYPDMVEDMVETACVLVEDALDQLLPHFDCDFASGWEDISCNSGPLVSVDFYNNVVVPRYKRIGAKLRAGGVDVWYTDCDGDIRQLLPGFLEAGLNCMFPFEVNGSGHPGALLDEYGKDLRIMGGVDKMALRAGRAAIREYLQSIEPYVARGGFIPFCDHRCPPDVKEEDYLYYLDLKEDMFGLKA
jgi:uroporphyrinogen decarboxylase